ncbi:M20/M25/M40 family metallo-hydrolase [Ectobacillus ponti]|uniref:M20/M25/M40 family metallo-hydrolase n=1 Tax=Ectobacillus ponti TaxID=2961894 RepID=A0AA41XCK4_9BACI|nr:M20/M25/M40 family metallo-hydrolase [Ectobacillus ponti]MCP8970849.1 M20/M25/M40 family metallo-hydrolase [Ectobacillus ponti]
MKTWNQLFVRQGFRVCEKEQGAFDGRGETEENMVFLLECLQRAGVPVHGDACLFQIEAAPIAEAEWLAAVEFQSRGIGEGLWFRPGQEEPKVRELDTYISGVVRELNRLGLFTILSCDGHGRRLPFVELASEKDTELAEVLLLAAGVKRVQVRRGRTLAMLTEREELLDVAEKLHCVQPEWLQEGAEYVRRQFFYLQVEELLSVSGVSGSEGEIRQLVYHKLEPFVDHMMVDSYGNLVAQKKCRRGNGPTILLNAHLDTVEELVPGRRIEKNESIWSSSAGILGADDRAGVAVLLETARCLDASGFSGTVKFLFTVEEEVGLCGAREVAEHFLWDVDAAIVVDRRGTGDIVTSCGGWEFFCQEAYGELFEDMAVLEGLSGWKCTAGGSSDTRIWAQQGIQSVNLSAGYQHEHTDHETLDVGACYGTLQLVKGVFRHADLLRGVLREIRRDAREGAAGDRRVRM